MSSFSDKNITSDKISHSSEYTISYLVYSVFKGRKYTIGHNLSTYYLKAPPTSQNGATNSVLIFIH